MAHWVKHKGEDLTSYPQHTYKNWAGMAATCNFSTKQGDRAGIARENM